MNITQAVTREAQDQVPAQVQEARRTPPRPRKGQSWRERQILWSQAQDQDWPEA